jgi:SAM-dependent methyltransferase
MSFISLVVDQEPKGVRVPREVTIAGRRYLRRCENYFLPLDADAKDVELLFDHMASRYDSVTDAALNCVVSRRLLERAMRHGATAGDGILRIADFGCGSGATWREWQSLAGSKPDYGRIKLFGCDLSEKMVDQSHRCGFSRAFRCSYAHTDFESDFFDVVLASFVMHYFNDRRPVHEIARILKPGGLLLATLPSAERKELDRYRSMLRDEASLRRIRSSETRTDTEQRRRIPILRCEKLGADETVTVTTEVDLPDEPSLV